MNTYLITSESYKLMNEEVNKIINDSLNVIKFDLRKDTMNDVLTEATYFSLMGDMKYIILGAGDLFKKKKSQDDEEVSEEEEAPNHDMELLEKYLDKPNEMCTLIITTFNTPDKRKKVYKKIAKEGKIIDIPTLSKKDLVYKCQSLLKEHKYFASYEVANYIVENSYVNYDIMTNELEKIYMLVNPKSLTLSDLDGIINESLNDNIFKYIYAIYNNDLKEAVRLSKDFDRLKVEPAVLLVVIAKDIEILYLIKNGMDKMALQRSLNKEDWAIDKYFTYADNFTLNELKKIIIKLNDYDYKYKSGMIDKSILIDLLTIDLCD